MNLFANLEISFINDKNPDSINGGIVCHLEISQKKDNSNHIYTTTTNSDKFICSSNDCSLLSENLKLNNEMADEQKLGNSNSQNTFTIDIPNYYIAENIPLFKNVLSTNIQFQFKSYIDSALIDAETDGRLQVEITPFSDTNYPDLYKNEDSSPLTGDTLISLEDYIKFRPKDDYYGLFSVSYRIVTLGTRSSSKSINFNVCYKYCNSCTQYNNIFSSTSSSPIEYKCTSCLAGNYFIDDENNHGTNLDSRCYSPGEIALSFNNYYFCPNSPHECTQCITNYYFVEDQPDKKCFSINYINTNYQNYYLPSGALKYEKCHESCLTCHITNMNCLSCSNDYYFVDEQPK